MNSKNIEKGMIISAVLISRNRPDNLTRLFDSIIATTSDLANFEVSARIDDDDILSLPVLESYQDRINIRIKIGKRVPSTVPLWNEAWKNATGEIFMMLGDDIVFRTHGWDDIIRNEFLKYPDRIAFIYGRDGQQDERLGTHGFLHRNFTHTLGFFTNPDFNIYYVDNFTDDITRRIKRNVYLPELYFEHMHYVVGKAKIDEVYQELKDKSRGDYQLYADTRGEPQLKVCRKLMEKYPTIGKFTDEQLDDNLEMANPSVPFYTPVSIPMTGEKIRLKGVTLVIVDDVDVGRTLYALDRTLEQVEPDKILYVGNGEQNKYPQLKRTIPHIEAYCRFMVNQLHQHITTSHCLVIQWDGFVLNGSAWNPDWMQYDYIGALWTRVTKSVGNGGFSLRSHKFLKAGASLKISYPVPEDSILCIQNREKLEAMGIKFAPPIVAKRFSIERVVGGVWNGQMGWHDYRHVDISKSGVAPYKAVV